MECLVDLSFLKAFKEVFGKHSKTKQSKERQLKNNVVQIYSYNLGVIQSIVEHFCIKIKSKLDLTVMYSALQEHEEKKLNYH